MDKEISATDRGYYDCLKAKIYREVLGRVEKSDIVLEIGCGDCDLAVFLAREKNIKVIGLDKDGGKFEETVAKCKEDLNDNVTCLEGDELILAMFRKEIISCVVMKYVFHEFEDPSRVLSECRRVMKKGGRIIVIDFIKGTLAEELWNEDYYTDEEIGNIISEAGFTVVDKKNISNQGPVLISGIKVF